MRRHKSWRTTQWERLENRWLLSGHKAHAPSFDFAQLTDYTASGASWDYQITDSIQTSTGASDSGTGQSNILISQSRSTYSVQTSNSFTDESGNQSQGQTTINVQPDSKGLAVVQVTGTVGNATTSMNLTGAQLAPMSSVEGKSYKDSGKFSGTYEENNDGTETDGTIKGSAKASSEILDTESVTVPAGTFSAIKGTFDVAMTGTLTLVVNGKKTNAGFSVSYPETFWAVQNVGIVQIQAATDIGIKVKKQDITVQANVAAGLEDSNTLGTDSVANSPMDNSTSALTAIAGDGVDNPTAPGDLLSS